MSAVPGDEEAIVQALRLKGNRVTPQRRAIIGEILDHKGHITPQAIVQAMSDRISVDASTVYRTLELLEEMGIVSHTHLGSNATYHLAHDHDHVHLFCRTCKTWASIPGERMRSVEQALKDETGFAPDLTHFAISGTCIRCSGED